MATGKHDERTWSRAQVQAILGRALERQADRGEYRHADLLETARELGISAADVEWAASQVHEEGEIEARKLALVRRQRRGLGSHLVSFLSVNAGLATIDLLATGGSWFFYVVVAWGIGLVLHAWSVLFADAERIAKQAEAEHRRALEKAEAERRRLERKRRFARLEVALEETVTSVADAIVRKLEPRQRPGGLLGPGSDRPPTRRDDS